MECEENSGKFDIKCLENKKYLSLFNKQIIWKVTINSIKHLTIHL
jgi:hypothetical protein